ncbi:MAG: hypothetical protein KAS49_03510, partial [Candidatus Cloacimonetes bacterium]|nr:hypothetical protein [Candidatus Cloacimonadota bacterium]
EKILQEQIIPLLESGKVDASKTAILARKNKYMNIIARILDEAGIDYLLESSASLLHHRAIKPIIFLMNFLIYDDAFELLKFLRSNLILTDGHELKEILKSIRNCTENGINWQKFFAEFKANEAINKIGRIKMLEIDLPNLITTIVHDFGFTRIFPTELDMKNLHKFIETALAFCKTNPDYVTDRSGFSAFCRAIEEKKEFTQLGLSDTKALKLMTIHKSKGLGFETVFAFIDGDNSKGNMSNGLQILSSYNQDLSMFTDCAFSYNYNKIMRIAKKELAEADIIRNSIEELNGIYVQLTRAANNLIIYDKVSISKKDISKIASENLDKLSIPKQLFCSLYHQFEADFTQLNEAHYRYCKGELATDVNTESHEQFNCTDISDYFAIPKLEQLVEIPEESSLHPTAISRGNIVHEYLSRIKFDSQAAREKAFSKVFADFGTLIPEVDFREIIATANKFLDENQQYFSSENWEKVFNERIVYDKKGNEKRIDRLLVNETTKKILIIDFKTGKNYNQQQIEDYEKLIENFKFVKENNYEVKGSFLEIK